VLVYVTAAAGIPVYLHYCGGELEEISYLTKTSNCCGDSEPEDDGCCKNEGLVLKCNPDITLQNKSVDLKKVHVQQLFSFIRFSFTLAPLLQLDPLPLPSDPPPRLQDHIVDSTILRI
jgi:hypothetical protein